MPAESSERNRSGATAHDLAEAVSEEIVRVAAEPLVAGLYLVATPIGNLADITIRALGVLFAADVVYCEDTRHSAKLLSRYRISAKTRPLHDHNEDAEISRVVRDIEAGKSIAVISDAGTPLISDPGFRIVRGVIEADLAVFSIPGASAAIAALTVSALPSDAFFFAGFLPPKEVARRTRLTELAQVPGSLVIYEAPHRLGETLRDIAEVLGNRNAVVARELTKLHEDVSRGSLAELAEIFASADIKGEMVIVVGPPQQAVVSDEMIAEHLASARRELSLKDASRVVAEELKVSKSRVYDIGLKAKAGKA